jgi:general secretion pathway protein A
VYALHFGLTERPFSLAPDPRYLYLSDGHREALAHLLYGLGEGGGFVQLTGEVGTGKTTVCRTLLDQLPPEVDVAMIFNPRLTSAELIATVCDELRVTYPAGTKSLKVLVDALSRALLDTHARGRRTVLIIDEAQNLSMEVLEELRLLTNLETTRQKLLQVILIGQPELGELLQRRELRQLSQRVTARYHLRPFALRETRAYVQHRMAIAGQQTPIFSDAALRVAHGRAAGVPRLINSVCDRALLGAFSRGRRHVTAGIVRRAAAEVLGRRPRRRPWVPAAAAAAVLVAVIAGATALGTAWFTRIGSAWSLTPPPPPAAPVNPVLATPPPTPPTPPPAPPRPSLAETLSVSADAADKDAAFATLYAQWGVEYRGTSRVAGCDYGRAAGFRCLARAGTWTVLRRLDLPAMLTLTTAAGDKHYAVLTALAEDTATVTIGERRLTLPLVEVERFWDGDFVTLWKAPALAAAPLVPGMGGRDIRWLRQRLGDLDGAPAGAGLVYDDDLKRRVVAFQQAHALTPDGIAGEETLLRLSTKAPGSVAPSLSGARP